MSYFSTINFPSANLGAFGDLQVAKLTPLVHLSFATGLRDQLVVATVLNGGTVDTSDSRLRLQSGTNIAGSAIVRSTKPVSYRAGQGLTARFTPSWASSAADSKQYFGMGNAIDGYFFGYDGTTFGVFHRLNGSDTHIPQSTWNGDKCDGNGASQFNWNKTYGVPMMIRYPFLGYGNITFWVQNPQTSGWILCHTIKYANTTEAVQLSNPILHVYGEVVNLGNNTNLTITVGSVGVFLSGEKTHLGPQYATQRTRATVTTEANIFALRNATNMNGVVNRGLMRLRSMSIASDGGNGIAVLQIKRNATLTAPTFTPIDGSTADNGVSITSGNSTASFDIVATFTGGKTLFNASLARNSSITIDLTPYNIYLGPTETLIFTVSSTASTTINVSVNWEEDVQ